MQKITPFLWYNGNVEEAVSFYTSIFKLSIVNSVNPMHAVIELEGQKLNLFNGGPMFEFTEAISLLSAAKRKRKSITIGKNWPKAARRAVAVG
jgi:predicted 3-demethylubiquinone-9 3-methyltransferase (glyoxalase superfamily)